jgi:hypothetical protein
MVSMLISVGTFVALNGGFIDDRGSTDSLQLAVALGVLGWLVGAVAYHSYDGPSCTPYDVPTSSPEVKALSRRLVSSAH